MKDITRTRPSTERLLIGAVLAVSFIALGLQALVLRPYLWPAGAGLALSGDTVMATLAAPRPVAVIRPPDVEDAAGTRVTVLRVWRDAHEIAPGETRQLDVAGADGVARSDRAARARLQLPDHRWPRWVQRALAYDKEKRPSTARELSSAIGAATSAHRHLSSEIYFFLFISARRRSISATAWPI